MHDYFQILGVPDSAPADEIRRALRRRPGRSHPDFCTASEPAITMAAVATAPGLDDVAIDFVEMSAVLDRMRAAFFTS
jgi:hypothetical protein